MSSKLLTQSILWLSIGFALVLFSTPLMAADNNTIRSSKSITFKESLDPGKQTKEELLERATIDSMSPLNKQGYRTESMVMAAHVSSTEYSEHGEITVYDAVTELISDFDYDGYYHRYSVAIDADTIYETSYIYVRLYLSYEGGPWNYYASSDNYLVHGDSELDTFVIETELADGYPPGYYDVRIELYDADNDDWLTSYGPYDDASLSALPLEDSYRDDPHHSVIYPLETEVVVAAHGGSIGWLMITLPLLLVTTRMLAKQSRIMGIIDQAR